MELSTIQKIAVWVIPVIFAITVHEVAHGWVACLFGDKTAKLSGRLTLNPAPHIDLIGTIIVPILFLITGGIIFGWAKPVPVDARNLRNPRVDMAIVAIAGPITNVLMAIIWALVAKLGVYLITSQTWGGWFLAYSGVAGILINTVLAVLNCLPVPPLDGGRVLLSLLPGRMSWQLIKYESIVFLLLVFLLISGWLSMVLNPPINFLLRFFAEFFGLPAQLFFEV